MNMKENEVTEENFAERKIIVCPVCHNRIYPYIGMDVAKAYNEITKGNGRCPYCGWGLTMYTDGATISEYFELYKDISKHFSNYQWSEHKVEWDRYLSKYMDDALEIEPDYIPDEFAFLRRGELGIVASRPLNGEELFFMSVMDQPVEDLEVIDLYSMESEFVSLCTAMGNKYRTMLEIEEKSNNHKSSRFDKLISTIRDMDHPDYIILFGIQTVQKNPFEPEEMHEILKELKALAMEKDTTIVIYSGLLKDCYEHTPSKEDLEKIGIDENLCALTVALKNHRVVYYRDNHNEQ